MPEIRSANPQTPGMALRRLRKERGWTLAEVSRRTGLLVSALSKIETGRLSPSYDKLLRICEGFDIDVSRLLSPEAPPAAGVQSPGRRVITRAGAGREIATENYTHSYLAAELLNKRFNPIVVDIEVRSIEEFGELERHPGEEFTMVIEGSVDFHSDLYTPTRLEAGDCVYFDSGMGHAYIRASDGVCRVVSACTGDDPQMIRKPL